MDNMEVHQEVEVIIRKMIDRLVIRGVLVPIQEAIISALEASGMGRKEAREVFFRKLIEQLHQECLRG